ncbi:hypothetical protein DVH24_025982 [Malus domestica]|uniref:Uncharacterized protein n=1 Tax=Malus domestica TaxID=3750 RepID=A0A498KHG9_MALDO|nr:hypothetical protein DVH24_025982 [Malus domestica]
MRSGTRVARVGTLKLIEYYFMKLQPKGRSSRQHEAGSCYDFTKLSKALHLAHNSLDNEVNHCNNSIVMENESASLDGAEQSPKPISVRLTEAEELEKYITIREEVYKKAKEFGSNIISFETALKRPYFHVRPLNSVELENWTSYLDFIERVGDLSKRTGDSPFCCSSRVGIYLVLKLPINLHILNSHQRFTCAFRQALLIKLGMPSFLKTREKMIRSEPLKVRKVKLANVKTGTGKVPTMYNLTLRSLRKYLLQILQSGVDE